MVDGSGGTPSAERADAFALRGARMEKAEGEANR